MCERKKKCKKSEFQKYREFKKKRYEYFNIRYQCSDTGQICGLKNCKKYNYCMKAAKINYEAWRHAYDNNRKAEMERLMRGGI